MATRPICIILPLLLGEIITMLPLHREPFRPLTEANSRRARKLVRFHWSMPMLMHLPPAHEAAGETHQVLSCSPLRSLRWTHHPWVALSCTAYHLLLTYAI